MIPELHLAVTAALALLSLLAGVYTLIGRAIDNVAFVLAVLVLALIAVEAVVGVVGVLTTSRPVPEWEYIAYLLGMVALLPVAGFMTIAERSSRWGMAILFIAAISLFVMNDRLAQLWYAA